MLKLTMIEPIACNHIADYYQYMWEQNRNIGNNLLRQGYRGCAIGRIEPVFNNLYKD